MDPDIRAASSLRNIPPMPAVSCPVCQLISARNSVLVPCCNTVFCSDCIRDYLLCPKCSKLLDQGSRKAVQGHAGDRSFHFTLQDLMGIEDGKYPARPAVEKRFFSTTAFVSASDLLEVRASYVAGSDVPPELAETLASVGVTPDSVVAGDAANLDVVKQFYEQRLVDGIFQRQLARAPYKGRCSVAVSIDLLGRKIGHVLRAPKPNLVHVNVRIAVVVRDSLVQRDERKSTDAPQTLGGVRVLLDQDGDVITLRPNIGYITVDKKKFVYSGPLKGVFFHRTDTCVALTNGDSKHHHATSNHKTPTRAFYQRYKGVVEDVIILDDLVVDFESDATAYMTTFGVLTVEKLPFSPIGGKGRGNGKLRFPFDVVVDHGRRRVYVSDNKNRRIAVFAEDGTPVDNWMGTEASGFTRGLLLYEDKLIVSDGTAHTLVVLDAVTGTEDLDATARWGTAGQDVGQFAGPLGMCVNGGDLLVVDCSNHRVQTFDVASGSPKRQWGQRGSGDGQLNFPWDIVVHGDIAFVSDRENHRICMFSLPNGEYLRSFGTQGDGEGQFVRPRGMAIEYGALFVCDSGNQRIQVFNLVGVYLGEVATSKKPYGVDIAGGRMYVVSYGQSCIDVFSFRTSKRHSRDLPTVIAVGTADATDAPAQDAAGAAGAVAMEEEEKRPVVEPQRVLNMSLSPPHSPVEPMSAPVAPTSSADGSAGPPMPGRSQSATSAVDRHSSRPPLPSQSASAHVPNASSNGNSLAGPPMPGRSQSATSAVDRHSSRPPLPSHSASAHVPSSSNGNPSAGGSAGPPIPNRSQSATSAVNRHSSGHPLPSNSASAHVASSSSNGNSSAPQSSAGKPPKSSSPSFRSSPSSPSSSDSDPFAGNAKTPTSSPGPSKPAHSQSVPTKASSSGGKGTRARRRKGKGKPSKTKPTKTKPSKTKPSKTKPPKSSGPPGGSSSGS